VFLMGIVFLLPFETFTCHWGFTPSTALGRFDCPSLFADLFFLRYGAETALSYIDRAVRFRQASFRKRHVH
jgi:hypothetical protein